jgi:hypothetical protein
MRMWQLWVDRWLTCCTKRWPAMLTLVWAMYPGLAQAAIHPEAVLHDPGSWSAQAEVSTLRGWVPPFRASPRDRMAAGGRAWVRPADPVQLDLRWAWLADSLPSSQTTSGPGDLSLGVTVQRAFGALELGGGWRVKLPNAQDEGELGSDETDVQILATAGRRWSSVSVRASAGLDIRGDPIRFANQDDIPQVWLSTVGHRGHLNLSGRVGGDLATSRSPARLEAVSGLVWADGWLVGLEGTAGLTPAAADWGAKVSVGWHQAVSQN